MKIVGVQAGRLELARFKTNPFVCGYLANETAMLEYRMIARLTAQAYEELLARGWRRFGFEFFRPACRDCSKCRSLRVLVNQFKASQSQRRNLRKNSHLKLVVQRPTVTREHLRLYNAYHADMHTRRGWPVDTITEEMYRRTYLDAPGDFAREFLYWEGERLVGVGLADVLPNCISSISFFHDPDLRADALGVFSVLQQVQFAKERQLPLDYLGYWIPECRSMAYKSQYRPHQILRGYPSDDEQPVWVAGKQESAVLSS